MASPVKPKFIDHLNKSYYDFNRFADIAFYPKRLLWCDKNRSKLKAPPLRWFKVSTLVKKYFPHHLNLLDLYCQVNNLGSKYLVKHFDKKFREETCTGQCMAFIEQIVENPSASPFTIFSHVKKRYDRVIFFQVLEYVREGLSEDDQHMCLEHFPSKPTSYTYDLNQATHEMNVVAMQGVFLVRYYDEPDRFYHSSLYVHYNNQFWFYDIYQTGLYVYDSAEKLHQAFIKHMKAFFPHSKDTYIIVERFLNPLSTQETSAI